MNKEYDEHQSMQQEVDQFQNDICKQIQSTYKCSNITRLFLSFLYFLIVGLVFLIKSHSAEGCDSLQRIGIVFYICCFILALLRVPLDLILQLLQWKPSSINCRLAWHTWLHYVELVIILLYLVLAAVVLIMGENGCDGFRLWNIVFLILTSVVLTIWAVIYYQKQSKWVEENQ